MVFISQGPIAVGPTNITTQNLVPAGAATANSAVAINPLGRDIISIHVTGTYTGALSLQKTTDGTNWETMASVQTFTRSTTGVQTATIASATVGQFYVSIDGAVGVRVTALAAVTGTATVTLVASDGNALVGLDNPLPAGANVIGAVTQSGTWTTGTSTPGTAATNLGKAEDAPHASGDTGVAVWGVRNDNATTDLTSATGDYSAIATDVKGAVFTRERSNATSTLSNVTASITSVTLLALNAARQGATIYNDSTSILYLKMGATATSTSFSTKLAAEDYYEVPFGYTGVIDGIWVAANGAARITEIS